MSRSSLWLNVGRILQLVNSISTHQQFQYETQSEQGGFNDAKK